MLTFSWYWRSWSLYSYSFRGCRKKEKFCVETFILFLIMYECKVDDTEIHTLRRERHVCMYVLYYYMHTCIYVCMYCMYVLNVCLYKCIYVRMYVCMYVCMYGYYKKTFSYTLETWYPVRFPWMDTVWPESWKGRYLELQSQSTPHRPFWFSMDKTIHYYEYVCMFLFIYSSHCMHGYGMYSCMYICMYTWIGEDELGYMYVCMYGVWKKDEWSCT